jgi:hypothetical protein
MTFGAIKTLPLIIDTFSLPNLPNGQPGIQLNPGTDPAVMAPITANAAIAGIVK